MSHSGCNSCFERVFNFSCLPFRNALMVRVRKEADIQIHAVEIHCETGFRSVQRRQALRGCMLLQCLQHMGEYELIKVIAPEEVQVLIMRNLYSRGMLRKLFQHNIDINQRIGTAIHKNSGCSDVFRRKSGNLIEATASQGCNTGLNIVVVHLEAAVAHDLEPVNH